MVDGEGWGRNGGDPGAEEGLPDRARPLAMRGYPEEQPVLSLSREGEVCVSEEGQSFRGRDEEEGGEEVTMKKDLNILLRNVTVEEMAQIFFFFNKLKGL